MCGDFKSAIYPILENKEYPMPTREELFNQIQKIFKSCIFTGIAMYCVTNTCSGRRQTRMYDVVKPASGIFQKIIESHFQYIPYIVVKIDVILIPGRTDDDEYIENLKNVFEILNRLTSPAFFPRQYRLKRIYN